MSSAAADSEPVLRLEGIGVRYPGARRAAVRDCTLTLAAGQRLALVGLNGSGKTTLLLVPVGLVPFSGRAEVAGLPVSRRHLPDIRSRCGFVFSVPDDQILFPRVLDDVGFSLRERGVERALAEQRSRELLELLGLPRELAEASPHQLSHGQRLRVALAGVLIGQPELLLLDEPSANLDPPGRERLGELLASLPSSMLLATHDMELARRCCTHFAYIHEGRLHDGVRPVSELERSIFGF